MALQLSIPDRISQIDVLSEEQIKEILAHPDKIKRFAADIGSTLKEMREQQQTEIRRIAQSNLDKKQEIDTIADKNKQIREEIDTLSAMNNSLQERKDKVLEVCIFFTLLIDH